MLFNQWVKRVSTISGIGIHAGMCLPIPLKDPGVTLMRTVNVAHRQALVAHSKAAFNL